MGLEQVYPPAMSSNDMLQGSALYLLESASGYKLARKLANMNRSL